MNKIMINLNSSNNGRCYSEELFRKYLRDYEIKTLKKQRIEKLLKIINNENK